MAARTYVQRALQAGERLPARAGAILSYWFGQDAHWPLVGSRQHLHYPL
jgi:hypothetical protein